MADGRCRIGTVMLVVGCSFVLKVPPRTSLLARGPVIDRATGQVVSLTRSRRLLSMADAKQIESTAKAAAEIHKAIFGWDKFRRKCRELFCLLLRSWKHGTVSGKANVKKGVS